MSLTARELREKYFNFFKAKGHAVVPSAPLVPENDPTTLFISAGMHPLVPYLLGEAHPEGKRLVSLQRCLRTVDIEGVGDETHHTFFEMLGNWSLGDYWKEEAIRFSFEFLTRELGIEKERLAVSCFAGDEDAGRDEESAKVWESLGIPRERMVFLPKEDNWWGPAGEAGPCGPDTEMFVDVGGEEGGREHDCRPGDGCGRWVEVWNDVFMEYNKLLAGKYEPLVQKNVDTGMGVERMVAVLSGLSDNYLSSIWQPIIKRIEGISGKKYEGESRRGMRIIADHLRAAAFAIADGVEPGNKERGYVLRRLVRRAVRYGRSLGIESEFCRAVGEAVIATSNEMASDYDGLLARQEERILTALEEEERKFSKALDRGLKELAKMSRIDGKAAFNLYQTYGFPLELTEEIAKEKGIAIDEKGFKEEFRKHQELSRRGSAGRFAGGLADESERVTRMHTATHLLHRALREVLGENVHQAGSNMTAERLRFDFSYGKALTEVEKKAVEKLVNERIKEDLRVSFVVEDKDKAIAEGALAFFPEKYPQKVKVYTVGEAKGEWWSKEICGGPHVARTGEIGRVRIVKEQAVAAGVRRIYATVE